MSKKHDVILEIFDVCMKTGNLVFNNDLVKKVCKKHKFGNPFDATKFDNSSLIPNELIKKDIFILHLGEGNHKFVKGIKYAYHKFEKIEKCNIKSWEYRKSILNEFDSSESNILSVASNQRIIHDFLYEDIIASPKVYNSRRTKKDLCYKVGNEDLNLQKIQMEIDLTMEMNGVVTVFEGKNGFPKDFVVYQLFHPFLYYTQLKIENKLDINNITCCYILRLKKDDGSILRLYNYSFDNPDEMSSIKLLKCAQYNLVKR